MSARDDMNRITTRIEARSRTHLLGCAVEALRSIKVGSELTGAPGQPVDTNNLRNSWQMEEVSPTAVEVSSNVEYALPIEQGVGPHGPLTLRSSVGGFHSVALTLAGFQRISDHVARSLGTGGTGEGA